MNLEPVLKCHFFQIKFQRSYLSLVVHCNAFSLPSYRKGLQHRLAMAARVGSLAISSPLAQCNLLILMFMVTQDASRLSFKKIPKVLKVFCVPSC